MLVYGINRLTEVMIDSLAPLLMELNQHMEGNLILGLQRPGAAAQPPYQQRKKVHFSPKPDSTCSINETPAS